MSLKLKMIMGYVIILVMVMIQSYLIVSMNGKRDVMSQQALALFQMNVVMKDRVIELKSLENDLQNLIQTKQAIPDNKSGKDALRKSCVMYFIALNQWHDAFLTSNSYANMNDALKQKFLDMKPYFGDIGKAIDEIRSIPPANVDARRNIFESAVTPAVAGLQLAANDFVGQNSQFFSAQNQSLLAYSASMERNQMITIAAAILFIILVTFYARYLLQPLNWLMDGINRIRKGDLGVVVRKRSRDELGRLADQFNAMLEEIKAHREHLEDMVTKRTEQLLEAKADLEKTNDSLVATNRSLEDARRIMDLDMKMAVNVQLSFFLKRPLQSDEWDVSFAFMPMSGVAGDMYDFYTDHSGKLTGASLMDVSGHGIASGLITMIAKSAIFRNFNKNPDLGLNRLMEVINDDLISELNNVDNYLTGILIRFKDNIVEYVNAGHPELLMKRAGTGRVDVVAPDDGRSYKGYFLGLEAMKMPFRQINFPMRKDDVILFFSDCLNESTNEAGEEYGIERVMDCFNKSSGSAGEVVNAMVNGLIDFTGSSKFNDDLTIIAIRRLV